MIVDGNGQRSLIPADLKGPQTAELSKWAPSINHPTLRAQIADIAWLNNRKNRSMADIAVGAYVECVKRYMSGEAKFSFDREKYLCFEVFDLLRVALRISRAVKGKADFPKPLCDVLNDVEIHSFSKSEIPSITRYIRLALDFGFEDELTLAERCEKALADQAEPDNDWNKHLWEEIRRIYRRNNLPDKENRCQLLIAECSVRKAREMAGSAMASSHWLMTAISELRQARGPDAKKRTQELRQELRDKQEDSIFELGNFSEKSDISDLVDDTIMRMEGLSLGEALLFFARIHTPREPEQLKQQARERMKQFPLSSLFSGSSLDIEGKVIATTEGGDFGGAGNDDAILTEVARDLGLMRNIVVASAIEPARHHIQRELNLGEYALAVICSNSAFIPTYHETIFILGFEKLFQGDMISAASILIPKFENSLRHVMKISGKDPSTIESDLTQVDRSISSLIVHDRPALVAIFGEELIFEIDMLFNSRKGPALRHEFAHGKYPAEQYYAEDVRYACWLIFRLTCLPIIPQWDQICELIDGESSAAE